MSLIREELAAVKSGRLEPVTYPRSPVPNASRLSNAIMSHRVDILSDASTTMDFSLGSGLERALEANVIQPDLAFILEDLLDVVTVAKHVWRTPNGTRDDADWMCKRARAVCHRLLAIPSQLPFPETSAHAAKTEALRLALLLMVTRCTNRMTFRSAQPNMRRLQRALSLHGIGTNWSVPSACAPRRSAGHSYSEPPLRGSHIDIDKDMETNTNTNINTERDGDTDTGTNINTNEGTVAGAYDENALLLWIWILMTGHFSAEGEPGELWFLTRTAYCTWRSDISASGT
jgi:hypothetical protein